MSYHNYGAAVSEVKMSVCALHAANTVCGLQVEVDVLTGDTTILGADLLYDCGKSLNPAIDIGQVAVEHVYLLAHDL